MNNVIPSLRGISNFFSNEILEIPRRLGMTRIEIVSLSLGTILAFNGAFAADPTTLPGTQPLTMEGDMASNLVAGVDKFLLRELDKSVEHRAKFWHRDFSNADAYNKSIEPNRQRLAKILGVADPRHSPVVMERVAENRDTALVGRGDGFEIFNVRW